MPHYTDYGGTSYADEGEDSEERDSELGENIYLRENSIYTIVDGPSWTEAEANANKLGGHLVTINDVEENEFIVQLAGNYFTGLEHFYDNEQKYYIRGGEEQTSDIWIGLNDKRNEGEYEWASGEPVDYIIKDELYDDDGNQDYGALRDVTDWKWDDQENLVAEKRIGLRYSQKVGIAETPFIRRGDSAYVIVEGPTWEEAEANANKLGGHLVTINDAEENQWLVDNFPHQTNWYTYWIGLNDAKEDNIYEWSSGENSSYRNWRPTSGPNRDSEDRSSIGPSYVEFQVNDLNESKAGQWNDHPPTHLNSPLGIAEIKIPKEIPEPVIRGNSIYTIVDGPSWTEAEANANKLSGHLVTINDAEENNWLFQNIVRDLNSPNAWIGLNDIQNEGQWEWISGIDSSYTNWSIHNGVSQPDNLEGDQDVAYFWDDYPSQWDDAHGGYKDNGELHAPEITVGLSETPFIRRGDSAYVIVEGPTWEEAEANANKLGGHLVTINDAEENQWLVDNLSGQDYFYLDNYGTDFYKDSYWIGFTSNGTNFSWVDGTTWEYENFGQGEPANNGSYGEITLRTKSADWAKQAGNWNDEAAENPHYGIAEIKIPKEIPEPVIRGNSIYTIVDGPSWTEAEANANKLGGHLVTINDKEEYNWGSNNVWSSENYLFNGYSENTLSYIGLNDKDVEGQYQWASKEETDWENVTDLIIAQNWFSQQGHFNGWDYGLIGNDSKWEEKGSDSRYTPYENRGNVILMDNSASFYRNHGQPIAGIAETPFIRRGDSAYVIVEGPTWEEAEANANKLGGHLVTINDAEENQWLVDQYYGEGKLSDKVPHLLIGFSDKEEEGIWNWQSGQDPTYTNWRSGEPDGTSTYKSSENYALFWIHDNYNTDPGQWGDIDNKGGWINEYHYGIAEIKIPLLNQDPIGTPLLIGDFIPGEIINVDLSGVSDPDNHEGFIPEYSYQWEVSADGENWEIRNQQGATTYGGFFLDWLPTGISNNPASYFLTPEDEGKQIRAHISYVDGKGKEESVTTDIFDIATRIDLTDENIRRFDPGSVDNINLINFTTLDEKLYRKFDWEEVNYEQINILTRDDIAWDKVVFRKAVKSDNFTIEAVDWDKVNQSRAAKSIYRTVDWDDVDYANMGSHLKEEELDWDDVVYAGMGQDLYEDLDWSKVQLKEAKRADSFSIDAVDWDEVNESKYAKSIYRTVDWDDVDYAAISDQLKDDIDWSRVQIKEAKRSDDFSIDVMDWDEINASKTAKGIYRNLDSDDFTDIDVNTLLKLEETGLLGRKMKKEIRSKINDSIVAGSETEPVFDLRNLDFDQVKLDLSFLNKSDKDIQFGLYIIENLDGAVKDPVTGELITPGSAGYEDAAMDIRNNIDNIFGDISTINEDGTRLRSMTDFYEWEEGKDMFAPFLEDKLTGEVYFAFDEANVDGEQFLKSNGDGTIGIKDDKNNDDFDDLIISFDLQSL